MKKSEDKEIKCIEDRTRWILWITISTLLILVLVFYLEFYNIKENSLTGKQISGPPLGGGGASTGGGGIIVGGGTEGSGGGGNNNLQGGDPDPENSGSAPVESVQSTGGGRPLRECENGRDDDGDGWIDYPEDPGCESTNEEDEFNYPTGLECSDNKDNDGDGLIDGNDPECKSPKDEYEMFECSDGKDNESPFGLEPGAPRGDGLIDAEDPGCWKLIDIPESYDPKLDDEAAATSQCQDKIDNDADGLIDLDDPDCFDKIDYTESGSFGGIDEDGDGYFDRYDNCPETYNPKQENKDGDKFGDACDNCPEVKNDGQLDSNKNGIGDACENTNDRTNERNKDENEGPSLYLIKNGELFNPGEFTRLAVIKGDKIEFNLGGTRYTIKIDEITSEYLIFAFTPPTGESETATLNLGDIAKIFINSEIVALKLDDLTEQQIAFITIVALGVVEEGIEQTPEEAEEELNALFSSVVEGQQQVSAEKSSQQEIEKLQRERKIALTIIVIAIAIVAVVWVIVLKKQMKKKKNKIIKSSLK